MNELIQGLLILKTNLLPDAGNWNVSVAGESIQVADVNIEQMSLLDAQLLHRLGWLIGDRSNDPVAVEDEDDEIIIAIPDDIEEWDEKTWNLVKGYFDNTFTYIL